MKLLDRGRWRLELLWEPRDCWVGVYWTTRPLQFSKKPIRVYYVCIVPMLPFRLEVFW